MTRSEQPSRLESEAILPAENILRYKPLIEEALEAFREDVDYAVQFAKTASKTVKRLKYK